MSPVVQSPKGLVPGEVFGRYAIESLLGTGGMARVYEARDSALHRVVALKILHQPGDDDFSTPSTGGSERIVREARALAALEHPNVVAVYDVGVVADGEHAGTAYLTMELVRGRTLRSAIADTSVSLDARVRWLCDAARGLAAAHSCGVIHRDVKPDNILVRADGVVKVLDFGIAKSTAAPHVSASASSNAPSDQLATLTGDGVVLGTPYYMSPEQMRGERIDARSDQFSWGIVAFQLLAGVAPWGDGLEAVQLIAHILSTKAPNVRTRNPDVPAWVADVIDRALAKDPNARFASMNEVVEALDRRAPIEARSGLSTGASAAVAGNATPRARGPGLAIVAFAIAALLIVVVFARRGAKVDPAGAAPPVTATPSTEPSAPNVVSARAVDASAASELAPLLADAGSAKVSDASSGAVMKPPISPRPREPNAPKPTPSSRIDPFGDQK